MKNRKSLLYIAFLALCSCGGGGGSTATTSSSASSNASSSISELPATAGGTPSSPTTLSLTGKNEINNNLHYNYFKYSAEKNEKIIIHSNLTIPLSDQQKSRCSSNQGTGSTPSSYDTQIHIYDETLNRIAGMCGEDITYVAPSNGTFVVNFEFPSNGSGFFNAAAIKGDSAISAPSGTLGAPNAPIQVSKISANVLNAQKFYNYYKFTIAEGKKLVINTQLTQPLSTQQKTRCASNEGRGQTPSSYDTQIHVFNSFYERIDGICGENLTFIAPTTGTFILHFSFGAQSAGAFYADEL